MPHPPPPPPLPDNGTIDVRYGSDPLSSTEDRHLRHELQTIHYRLNETTHVATCTLNEPKRLNALTTAQLWECVQRHALVTSSCGGSVVVNNGKTRLSVLHALLVRDHVHINTCMWWLSKLESGAVHLTTTERNAT